MTGTAAVSVLCAGCASSSAPDQVAVGPTAHPPKITRAVTTPLPGVYNGAPPTVVCGQTLWNGAAGPVLVDAWSGDRTITHASSGGYVFLRVASGCDRGAQVTYAPSDAASVVRTAASADGKLAAVVLDPHRGEFTVRIQQPGGGQSTVQVRLAATGRRCRRVTGRR